MSSGSGYQIWADAISVGGGDDQSSDNYNIDDTLGEFALGRASSTNYGLRPGFREINEFSSTATTITFSMGASSLDLGKLSTGSTSSGSVSMTIESNSSTGISITYSGSTLTCSACSGNKTVNGIGGVASGSSAGSSQFGFNVIYNSGTAPVATATSVYSTAGSYAFSSGNEVVSSTGSINETTFNTNFIANIDGSEKNGIYATTITYTAVANP
jgi:hypothetical protein